MMIKNLIAFNFLYLLSSSHQPYETPYEESTVPTLEQNASLALQDLYDYLQHLAHSNSRYRLNSNPPKKASEVMNGIVQYIQLNNGSPPVASTESRTQENTDHQEEDLYGSRWRK
jgi:hypothetical protein